MVGMGRYATLPKQVANFLHEFHSDLFPSINLPLLPLDRSKVDVHAMPLAILESLRKEGSHLSVVRPRPPNVDQRHGCAPSPPRHRLQLKKKLMPVWPSMQQTTLDSFTSGPKDNASRRDAVGLSIPVRVDLLVREHGIHTGIFR